MRNVQQFHRVLRLGTLRQVLGALCRVTGCKITFSGLDQRVQAWRSTDKKPLSDKEPAFWFSDHFFARLSWLPSFDIEVRESKSQIRKTCYGFRHRRTGERVYLRVDPGSLVEFRVHLSGYVVGRRYVIPGLNRLRPPFRWDKIERLVRMYQRKNGIIVKRLQVQEYYKSFSERCSLGRKVLLLKFKSLRDKRKISEEEYAEAVKKIRELSRLY